MSNNQPNNMNCELRKFERNNYFYGKLMTVRDFEQEQQYFNNKRWLINKFLFGSGTVCGLSVEKLGAHGIKITPGIAIDPCGHEIVVPDVWENDDIIDDFNISAPDPGNNKNVHICLTYDDHFKEKVSAQLVSTCEEICENNRIQESFKVEIIEDLQENTDLLCDKWSNYSTKYFSVKDEGNEYFIFSRTVRLYVSEGDTFEVILQVTAIQDNIAVSIMDKLPQGLTLIDGTLSIQASLSKGEVKKWKYIVRVDPNPPDNFEISTQGFEDTTKSIINIISSGEITAKLLKNMVSEWTNPCINNNGSNHVILAELSINNEAGILGLEIDNTKRNLVYNNYSIGQMLECLKRLTTQLEDKKRMAPNNIQLDAFPPSVSANGNDSSTITTTVTNDYGETLSGIPVNIISTLGSISDKNENSISELSSNDKGEARFMLKSTNPGTATVIVSAGIATAFVNVEFSSVTGEIEGLVTDSIDNQVIQHARVVASVGTLEDFTDDSGKYILNNVPIGNHTIEANADGYDIMSAIVQIKANERVQVDFPLVPVSNTGNINGEVKDDNDGVIEGATVSAISATSGGTSTKTDSNGKYALNDVSIGSYTVTAIKTGYKESSHAGIVVRDNETTTKNFILEPQKPTLSCELSRNATLAIDDPLIEIIATLKDGEGNAMGEMEVTFSTDLGTLFTNDPNFREDASITLLTKDDGKATAILKSSETGIAIVKAEFNHDAFCTVTIEYKRKREVPIDVPPIAEMGPGFFVEVEPGLDEEPGLGVGPIVEVEPRPVNRTFRIEEIPRNRSRNNFG